MREPDALGADRLPIVVVVAEGVDAAATLKDALGFIFELGFVVTI